MEMKNKLAVAGLIVGLATFDSTVASAARICQELPGQLQEITVAGNASSRLSPGYNETLIATLKEQNLIRLDERAKMTCSNSNYCVEEKSIKSDVDEEEFFVTVITVKTSAVLNCLK